MNSTCLLVPVYNHPDALGDVISKISTLGIHCLLVNDGSDARCSEIMRDISKNRSWISLTEREHNGGKGAAVKTGMEVAAQLGFTHILQIDADGQHKLEDIPRFIQLSEEFPDAVISGVPVYQDIPRIRFYGRYLTHVWVWINTLSTDIKDAMCGFRVYPLDESLQIVRNDNIGDRMDFDPEILVRLHWKGVPVVHIPTLVFYPTDGISHFRAFHDNLLISWMHTRLFFGMLRRLPKLLVKKENEKKQGKRWSDIGELGFLRGMRVLFWIFRHSTWLTNLILRPVALFYYLTNKAARDSSLDYLHRVHDNWDDANLPGASKRSVFHHMLSFAESSLDKLGVWADPDRYSNLEFPSRQLLLDQIESGRGAVLLGAHLGNMEICRRFSHNNKMMKLNVLVHTHHADKFNKLLRELNAHHELELIEVTEITPATAIRLSECVARGEFIAVLADRIPVASRGRSQAVSFLGAEAFFPEGPFILAAVLKAPVYTLFCTRIDSHYFVECEKLADEIRLPHKDRASALKIYMQVYAKTLEKNIRRAPLQWFNFYPFWDQAS